MVTRRNSKKIREDNFDVPTLSGILEVRLHSFVPSLVISVSRFDGLVSVKRMD